MDTSRFNAAEVNQQYSRSAHLVVRFLLLNKEDRVSNNFKTLHAATTHKVFEAHGLGLDRRVKVSCGHCFPALQHKHSIVAVEKVLKNIVEGSGC